MFNIILSNLYLVKFSFFLFSTVLFRCGDIYIVVIYSWWHTQSHIHTNSHTHTHRPIHTLTDTYKPGLFLKWEMAARSFFSCVCYVYKVSFQFFLNMKERYLAWWWVRRVGGSNTCSSHTAHKLLLKAEQLFDAEQLSWLIIIIICRQHGYPWPSLATPPYRSSLLAGLQGYIPYPHRAAVCMFELAVLLLFGHTRGSIGVHHLWARPCFSSSVLPVWSV